MHLLHLLLSVIVCGGYQDHELRLESKVNIGSTRIDVQVYPLHNGHVVDNINACVDMNVNFMMLDIIKNPTFHLVVGISIQQESLLELCRALFHFLQCYLLVGQSLAAAVEDC
jgi:hypothetical protein